MNNGGEPIPGASGEQERGEFRKPIDIKGLSVASEPHPDRNEDSIFQLPEKRAFGVFDGIGGHEAGDKASQLARDRVADHIQNIPEGGTVDQAQEAVRNAFVDANKVVLAQADGNRMGSTAVAGYIWEGQDERKAIIGSVGDSRAYLMRDGKLVQITVDDDLAREAANGNEQEARAMQKKLSDVVDPSQLSAHEQALYQQRNIIKQAIGKEPMTPNMYVVDLQPGDKLLLTSDGITDNLTTAEIEAIIKASENGEATVQQLIEASRASGRKRDDMSAILVDMPSDGKVKSDLPKADNPVQPDVPHVSPGDVVRVRRSSGDIEDDWRFVTVDEKGDAIVIKTEGSQSRKKIIPKAEFSSLNSPKQEPGISDAQDFDQLFQAIDRTGEIKGSQQSFTPDQLRKIIAKVRGGAVIESITSTGGLREKVAELLQMEKIRKDLVNQ